MIRTVYYIPVLDVTERVFAVLYVSIMGLTRCYKTKVFLRLSAEKNWRKGAMLQA